MCVRVYVCEQLVLPESLLNYLKPAFRILNTMLLCLFLTFSGTSPPPAKTQWIFVQYDCKCPALDCFKENSLFLF